MLKILKAEDAYEVKQLVLVVYGAPGLGKTTLAFSSKEPLLIDFDHGGYRANVRGDSVIVNSWNDVLNINDEDMAPYNTVVIDTAGTALDFLTTSIITNAPKMGMGGGGLTRSGYGALKNQFISWLKSIKSLGKDVILVAHSTEEKRDDEILERLDIIGGSKNEVYKSSDAMGRLKIQNGKRVLTFDPSDIAFGKNPGNLPPIIIPTINTSGTVMADILDEIKSHLNQASEIQAQKQVIIHSWNKQIEAATTGEEFSEIVSALLAEKFEIRGVRSIVKAATHKAATALGLVYTKDLGYEFPTQEIIGGEETE